MQKEACESCKEILEGKSGRKHANLRRNVLAASVGYHGACDNEYYFDCAICGFRFVGATVWESRPLSNEYAHGVANQGALASTSVIENRLGIEHQSALPKLSSLSQRFC